MSAIIDRRRERDAPNRRLGFELEDGGWRTWKSTSEGGHRDRFFRDPADSRGVRPMAKHEPIHDATDFTLEADEIDEDGVRLSDLEFVTAAFPLTSGGQAELVRGLGDVAGVYAAITPLVGRDHARGDFVWPHEHHLSHADVLLSRGAEQPSIRVQATHAVTLSDLPRLCRALTAPRRDRRGTEATVGIPGRSGSDSTPWVRAALEPLRSAPTRASRLSIGHLERMIGRPAALADTAALEGLLTAVITFVRGMHARAMTGGIKTFLPVMHRNDFATMFALLPAAQRQLLRAHRWHFIEAVLAGVFGDPDRGVDHLSPAALADRPVVKSLALNADDRSAMTGGAGLPATVADRESGTRVLLYRPLPQTLTIARWIGAWMDAHDPADLLTAARFHRLWLSGVGAAPARALEAIRNARELAPVAHLIDWRRSYEQPGQVISLVFVWERLSAPQQAILVDCVRGLGGLGSATDAADGDLVLFENRMFPGGLAYQGDRPGSDDSRLTVSAATDAIVAYFSRMRELFGTA